MTLEVFQLPDGSFRVTAEDTSAWHIEPDPGWGIKITCIGASLIPLSLDLIERPDIFDKQRKQRGIGPAEPVPVPLILCCPGCAKRHIDEGEWATRNHHTHACQFCGVVWRPAVVDTVGVQFLPGFKNKAP